MDVLLVDDEIDLRYLTGFTGSNGLALVSAAADGPLHFLTDFRYTAQSEAEVGEAFARQTVAGELYEALRGLLGTEPGRLGFDEAKLTVRGHRAPGRGGGEGWELVRCKGLFEGLRAVKEPAEIALIAAGLQACRRGAARDARGRARSGGPSARLPSSSRHRMRRMGAEAPSFPSIVAFGEHGALPHAQPRDVEIPPDVLVTIDWGAVFDGYCSDCTRTYATGEAISDRAREVYALVLAAQEASLAAVRSGPNGREVDAVARDIIDAAGEGENFGHGLGHGVGMEVHEAPRLSRTAGEEPLVEGNIVTVEPGVYLPGMLGVRIEDLVVVRSDGPEVLTTGLSKALTVIG